MDTKQKVKIVFDTDIGGDCDDAGALAMLHRLCDLGEAQLVAVTASYASPFVAGCIDAVKLLRKVLSQAENHSITFVVTGSMTTAAGLVCSTPDEFSPLFGKELISQKICRTVVMGGSFYG